MLDRLVRRSLSRRSFLAGLGATAALPVIAACEPQIVEKVVEKPVEVVVTRVVQEVVEKEVVVEKAVEVEKEVTRVVQEVVEVEKETLVEVEKEVVVEVEKVVTVEVEKEVFKEIVVAAAGAPYLPRTDSMPAGGIRFATWGNAMDEAVEAWNESFPDNLVKHEITPYGEHTNKILIEMAAGTAPDTILISGAFFHTVAAKGVLWGYNDAIKADKLDLEGWAVDQRHWSSWPRGGEIYGFHHHAPVIDTVYYNKEIMAEAGVGTTIDHFWNLSDYQELATALNGNAPDVWGSNGLGSTRTFHGFLAGLDGKFFVDEDESAVNMTSDECREALRIITAPYLEWGRRARLGSRGTLGRGSVRQRQVRAVHRRRHRLRHGQGVRSCRRAVRLVVGRSADTGQWQQGPRRYSAPLHRQPRQQGKRRRLGVDQVDLDGYRSSQDYVEADPAGLQSTRNLPVRDGSGHQALQHRVACSDRVLRHGVVGRQGRTSDDADFPLREREHNSG